MTFTLALLCDTGCETLAAIEAKELLKKEAIVRASYVLVEGCTPADAVTLCYRSQLASRVLVLICEGTLTTPEDLPVDVISAFDYAPYQKENASFRAECDRRGEHEFQSPEIETIVADAINEKTGCRIELKRPDLFVHCQVRGESYVLGVDLAGRDLGKRDYKVFHTRQSMRGTTVYAAVREAGYTGKERLVDPSSHDGTFLIEAALLSAKASPQRFRKDFSLLAMPLFAGAAEQLEKMDAPHETRGEIKGFTPLLRTLQMARQNAKLAGVETSLSVTRCDLSWLDTKLEKSSADIFITVPPSSGKSTPLKDVEQLQEDLFSQAAHALTKKGTILLVAEKKAEFLNASQRHGFCLASERTVFMGGKELLFLRFMRA